uniref:Uncharacterized protein n=1 Tax=Avena sativa TaxID=4498 RepID=A0ACD5USP9_AVESA
MCVMEAGSADMDMSAGDEPSAAAAATVRATVVQASTVFYDTPATIEKAEGLIAEAGKKGSQLVLFPEVFVGGFPRGSTFGAVIGSGGPGLAKGKEDYRKYFASAIDVPGPEVTRLGGFAAKYKVYLVIGVVERDVYTLYNTVLFFSPLGELLGKHRKLVPTALEQAIWACGDGSTLSLYDTPVGKIGALVCWENKMPLARTALYGKGIQIYCAPTADDSELWLASMRHIAVEGGCFVMSANQFCLRKDYPPPPGYTFAGFDQEPPPETVVCCGGSVIVSPSGTVLAGPNYEGEGLVTADLDLGEIVDAKFGFDVVGHSARPEVLTLIVKDQPQISVCFTSASANAPGSSSGSV